MGSKVKTGTTRNTPWQVKGVTPETREAVKHAARKSGKTIGEWVNDTLHKSAVEDLTAKQSIPAKRLEDQLAEITARLDELQKPWWQRLLRQGQGNRSNSS